MKSIKLIFIVLALISTLSVSYVYSGEKSVDDVNVGQIIIPARLDRPRVVSDTLICNYHDTLKFGYKRNSEGFSSVMKYIVKNPPSDTGKIIQGRIKIIIEEIKK